MAHAGRRHRVRRGRRRLATVRFGQRADIVDRVVVADELESVRDARDQVDFAHQRTIEKLAAQAALDRLRTAVPGVLSDT